VRYGIISDVHANLAALEVVLRELRDVDRIVCLGDVVGYGPCPVECCAKVHRVCEKTIRGNHDVAALELERAEWFNEEARAALYWTHEQLDSAATTFLRSLPVTAEIDGALLVHGAPSDPDRYILSVWDALAELAQSEAELIFFGHTHLPEAYVFRAEEETLERVYLGRGEKLTLGPRDRALVNVGSVGQPRDGDPRAAFGIFDSSERTIEVRRVEYPIARTQELMRAANLPEWLSQRLEVGG